MTRRTGKRRAATNAVVGAVILATLFAPRAKAAEAQVSGLLDLVAAGKTEAASRNVTFRGPSPFDGYQVRIFVDGAVSDRLQVFTQLHFTEAVMSRAVLAYAMANPWEGKDLHFVAGLVPWLIGTYEARSYSDKNPLVGTPMLYQYHTSLRGDQVAANADQLLSKAGRGYEGITYEPGARALPGLPVIYGDWWDFGAGFLGSLRPLEFAVGYINGAPSIPSPDRDDNEGKTLLGRIGLAPTAGTSFGVSGSYGPYLADVVQPFLPPGSGVGDYNQVLAMADLEWAASHLAIRAEGYRNTWETPNVGDLRVDGFYAEAKYTLPAGFYVAGRYEIMRFSDIADSTGVERPWDHDQTRIETGVGYRITRGAVAKAVFQRNIEEPGDGSDSERFDLVAAQLSIRF